MGLLNALDDVGGAIGDALSGGADLVDKLVGSSQQGQQRTFEKDGFIVPAIPSGDGNGLPSSKILPGRRTTTRRHIIKFFVPETGVVELYINPSNIEYNYDKYITQERTKGGYVLSYWGENLTTLNIRGTTGSSGIEGINVLQEVYRSEQINFDPVALSLAADSTISGLGDLISATGNAIGGGVGGLIGNVTSGLFGLNPLTQSIMPRTPPTLASLAFTVEMYYSGIVYRGYFKSMSVSESAEQLGLFSYNMQFVVTQTRGYRLNTFGWQRSAVSGPSNNSQDGGIPLSYRY